MRSPHSASTTADSRGTVLGLVLSFAERVKRMGIKLRVIRGPWHTDEQAVPRSDRDAVDIIPVVTNGRTSMMVDTLEHAVDLAGLLNWCGIKQLNPVAALRLPPALAR